MYYHVLVEVNEKIGNSNESRMISEIDIIDKNKIINDIIVPFLKEEEFILNGFFLKKKNIIRFKICSTERSAHELSDYENDRMPGYVIMYISPEDILSYDKYISDITKELIDEAAKILNSVESITIDDKPTDKCKVFIVHGHDKEAKIQTARFIEKLGLEAIILHEQVSKGMTIIEKIEEYSNIGFCIILYTPCDIGYDKNYEEQKMSRARQNVVFEHGYMTAKLGRSNVCALVKGTIEKPNDISGVLYINMDENDGWKIQLAKELHASGYNVNFNLIV